LFYTLLRVLQLKDRLKLLIKNRCVQSFLMAALAYYLFLSYSQVFCGKYIILQGDALAQNISSLKWCVENILQGKSISYTWSSYLGMNSYISLANGMILSIFGPIFILFHNFDYSVITSIMLIIKAGIAAAMFCLYMERIWKIKGFSLVVFSVFYALCGFQVAYVPQILYYSDSIFMLPIILYLVSEFAESGRFKLLCLAYFYQFLNVFYIGYIIGFFSLFYLIAYFFFIKKYSVKNIINKLINFSFCIILVAGATAIVLYPMAYFLFTKYLSADNSGGEMPYIYLSDIYNQFFVGQNAGVYSMCPYIYCGLPALVLFPIYFVNKKIDIGEKILFGCLILLLIISCLFKPLYLFWHCFDYPDGFYFRYTFIISFLICVVACRQVEYAKEIKIGTLLIVVIVNLCFYAIYMLVQPYIQNELYDYPENNITYFFINLALLSVYFVAFFIQKLFAKKDKIALCLKTTLCLVVLVELTVNGYSVYYKHKNFGPENYYDTFNVWNNCTEDAINTIKSEDSKFYRISCLQDYAIFGSLYFNYNGLASFSSFENIEVRDSLEKMGVYTSPRIMLCYGLTDFTKMILSVGYNLNTININSHEIYSDDFKIEDPIEKNDRYLSIGFLVNSDVMDFSFSGRNVFNNINELAYAMTGIDKPLYEQLKNGLWYEQYGIEITLDDHGTYRMMLSTKDDKDYGVLVFKIPLDERQAFVQFDYGVSAQDKHSPYVTDGVSGSINPYQRLAVSYISPLTKIEDSYETTIYMDEGTYDDIPVPEMNYAYYNLENFYDVYDYLKNQQMEIIQFDNGYVHGLIDVKEENKILFTSIPYDEGWEVKVNGEKTEPLKILDGAFVGLDLEKGTNDIIFEYHVPGFKIGAAISVVSVIILAILFIFPSKSLKKNNK